MKVFKYYLTLGENAISLPHNAAEILSVGLDGDNALCLWAKVDDTVIDQQNQYVYVAWTGLDLPSEIGKLIGTVRQGPIINHIFHLYT